MGGLLGRSGSQTVRLDDPSERAVALYSVRLYAM
jgi:hypothetical protein